jgi:type IV pilus assembly protein PilE
LEAASFSGAVCVVIIRKNRRQSNGGFTLIELMTVVIVVAVLMAIALPAYQNQVLRGHRAAAKGEMLEIANRQQQYLLANRTYTNDATDFAYTPPADVAARYSFSLSTVSATGVPSFTVTFQPIGTQLRDGADPLTLNSEGVKTPADKWER